MKIGRWILLALVPGLVYLILAGVFFDSDSLWNIYGVYRRNRQMRNEITGLTGTIDSLQLEIKRLANDTTYLEQIAREKLGMAREDETVYKFTDKD